MKAKSRSWKHKKWRSQNYLCPLCGLPIVPSGLFDVMLITVDHIRPKSHGGGDEDENLQLTHSQCNLEKGNDCSGCEACKDGREGFLLWLVLNPRYKRERVS